MADLPKWLAQVVSHFQQKQQQCVVVVVVVVLHFLLKFVAKKSSVHFRGIILTRQFNEIRPVVVARLAHWSHAIGECLPFESIHQ